MPSHLGGPFQILHFNLSCFSTQQTIVTGSILWCYFDENDLCLDTMFLNQKKPSRTLLEIEITCSPESKSDLNKRQYFFFISTPVPSVPCTQHPKLKADPPLWMYVWLKNLSHFHWISLTRPKLP